MRHEPWHYDATEGNPRGKRPPSAALVAGARFKFQMMKALNADDRLKASTFKVAMALLDFMNGENGDLYPSIEAICDATALKDRAVRNGLAQLRDAGWIEWTRGNRQRANFYTFDDLNLKAMLQKIAETERKRSRKKRVRAADPDRHARAARTTPEIVSDRHDGAAPDRHARAAQ